MKLLLDTHAVIWFYLDDDQLSVAARNAIEAADELYVSVISAWEYGIKRKRHPVEYSASFEDLCAFLPATRLDLEFDLHVFAEKLPPIHRDPFDRMMIAQAINSSLMFLTKDRAIHKYPVPTLW